MEVAFWSTFNGPGKLDLMLNCNDVFGPAADAEVVPVESVHEVLALALSEPDWRKQYRLLMKWVHKRRNYPENMAWFCDRVKPTA